MSSRRRSSSPGAPLLLAPLLQPSSFVLTPLAIFFAFILLLPPLLLAEASDKPNYSNGRYKVYQIRPGSEKQMELLGRMEELGIVDFWRHPTGPNATGDVMVDTKNNGLIFLKFLQQYNVEAKVLVDDLSKLIEDKEIGPSKGHKFPKFDENGGPMLRDEPDSRFDNFGLRMGEYYDMADITAFMQRVHDALPGKSQMRTIGWTVEGRPIQGIQFGNPSDLSRPIVWIDAGIHAREWTAVHTAVYFIYYIANQIRLGQDTRLLKCLERLDILVLPCLNPDGYEFTRSEPRNPAVRMWRKNRSKERCVTNSENQVRCCKGVDLNRNFDFKFAEGGTSFYPCSEIFHGANSFSEVETRAVRDAILGSDMRGRIPALITMHAYSQLWIYPYSNRRHTYPPDVEELKAVARRAVTAIADKYGTNYQYGTGPETIYAYTGGSSDWAKEKANIKYTYTVELRPSYWSWNGFVLDRSLLIPTARETFDGVMVVLETAAKDLQQRHFGAVTAIRRSILSAPLASSLNSAMCEDAVPYCRAWLSKNARLCVASRSTMQRECRRTCSLC